MSSRCPAISGRQLRAFAVLILCALITVSQPHALADDHARRLILKDGSYQLVTKYEVKGDRVRYKSAERDEWEELPSSLVDWTATEKYEKDRSAAPAIPEASALDKETDAEREAEQSHLPQVAPGLRLPEDSGVFLLDNFQGQPQLVELKQTEGDINRNTKGNIFRGAINPIASAKQTVELEGEHAAIHAHVAVPSIYINVEDEPSNRPPSGETASAKPSEPSLDAPRAEREGPQQPQRATVPFDRFRIVRAKVKGGKRIVGDIKRAVTGKVSQDQSYVKTTIDRISGGWLKLTPAEDLSSGEYVVVEMKGNEGMNLYVWDFGVNPNAPANTNPWKPDVKDPGTLTKKPGDGPK
ncbi:MAG: hypothetical protein JWQ87_211 [Candidatus Sulfotelmatobacter sp.]|nr:hypothetical protein [Candidatus Sulfotelmatobacter sp.]